MKRVVLFLILILTCFSLTGCSKDYTKGKHYVEISVENYGKIKLELDADVAPITVSNFMKLVNQKFYDGTKFHRIIYGFMIQGGAPKEGEEPETIVGEFSANGYQNDILHERGVISMARANAMDSASSQFFIVHQDSPHLNGKYAAFGHVISGMSVVDKLAQVPVIDNNVTVAEANRPVIEYIREVEK